MKAHKILFFVLAIFSFSVSHAQNDLMVSSLNDNNREGTLRWAITTANKDSDVKEIKFQSGLSGTLRLSADLPPINSNIKIIGPGAENVVISGSGNYHMFEVNKGFNLEISGFTFTNSANNYNKGTIFDVSGSTVRASDIVVEGIANPTAFWSKGEHSSISIFNATFKNNAATLFRSHGGATPIYTSDNESDYTNRITVSRSTFSYNRDLIFSTENYVKIDDCTFKKNYGQIASFRGVNRYQVLNSNFVENTGHLLFTFSSKIGDTPSWGRDTLGANNTLFDGNVFQGNRGTIVNTGGGFKYDSKTTITNNIFINNGNKWYGNPLVATGNQENNFITSVKKSEDDGTVFLTLNKSLLLETEDEGH